jgi:type IV secretion system protein VirB10
MIGYAVVAIFCGFIAFVAYAKQQPQAAAVDNTPQPRVHGESPAQIARRLMSARRQPPAAPSPEPTPRAPREPTVLVASVDEPPLGTRDDILGARRSLPPAAALSIDEESKERRAALRRALTGSTAVQLSGDRSRPAAARLSVAEELERVQRERANFKAPDPAARYEQAMQAAMAAAQGQATGVGGQQPSAAQTMPPPPAGPTGVGAFNRPGASDRFWLGAELQSPRSRFILQPGRGGVIPAVLDSAVNSQLPGPVLGHVAVDVYDSITGKHLLIPQGSGLYGEYAAGVVFGQSRLMVAWQRITLPDGRTIDIGEMPGTDGLGRSGFTDEVDNHYFRIFSSALLLSGVTAGLAMSQDVGDRNSQRVSAGSAMSQALGQQLGQTTSMLLQKNMNIAPTLDIGEGYRFNIIVTKDVVFQGPYRRAS